jgi:hypothetical protein
MADYEAESWVIKGLVEKTHRSLTGTPYKRNAGVIVNRNFLGSIDASDFFDTSEFTYGPIQDPISRINLNVYYLPSKQTRVSDYENDLYLQPGYVGDGFVPGDAIILNSSQQKNILFATFGSAGKRDSFFRTHYDNRLIRRKEYLIKKYKLVAF